MLFDWRTISGPVLAAAISLTALTVDHFLVRAPNPAPLLICIVAFAGSVSGFHSAIVSAAIAVVGSALFFLDRAAPGYDIADLVRLAMLAVTASATAAITGLLRQRLMETLVLERVEHAGLRRRSTRSTSASSCLMLTRLPNSSTARSAIISRFPTPRRTASGPSSR